MHCVENVVCASTTSHVSLHFDGFEAADFLNQLEQRLMGTTGFTEFERSKSIKSKVFKLLVIIFNF